jgi:hypothetical protein
MTIRYNYFATLCLRPTLTGATTNILIVDVELIAYAFSVNYLLFIYYLFIYLPVQSNCRRFSSHHKRILPIANGVWEQRLLE